MGGSQSRENRHKTLPESTDGAVADQVERVRGGDILHGVLPQTLLRRTRSSKTSATRMEFAQEDSQRSETLLLSISSPRNIEERRGKKKAPANTTLQVSFPRWEPGEPGHLASGYLSPYPVIGSLPEAAYEKAPRKCRDNSSNCGC